MGVFDKLVSWAKGTAKGIASLFSSPAQVLQTPGDDAIAKTRAILAESVRRCFATSTDPDGNAWAPLKWRTGKPLILTGYLLFSAEAAATDLAPSWNGLAVTMDRPFYGLFHQAGTKTIPARKFLGIGAADAKRIAEIVGKTAVKFLINTSRGFSWRD